MKQKDVSKNLSSKPPIKRMKFPELASACDRTGVSDRATALTRSVISDLTASASGECSFVIDRSKVRRERSRKRKSLQQQGGSYKPLFAVYFDGRRDITHVSEQIGKHFVRKKEHISLKEEPKSRYLGNFAVKTGSAKVISDGLLNYLETNEIITNHMIAVGCDGTAVNTGPKGGAI
ncbi:Hypothetical predicted protein [Octopus vulgaris]|uniref:Uncharacterized protein n=1 Tax=Octopus vulgaris TaxID=6645 RepID=A0AA36BFK6_OCTVU|nr:Hypothetical predicted protein [Octopus vulgaris]